VAITGQTLEHVTTKYTNFPISTYLSGQGKNKVPFVFWDTWGYSGDEEYTNINISAFVKGYVTAGFTRLTEKENSYSSNYDNSRAREMHVVLIIVPLTARKDPSVMDPLKKAVGLINKAADMAPIIVITRTDAFLNEETLANEKALMLKELPVAPMDVFFHRNYVTDLNCDQAIDQSSRTILLALKNKASVHMLRKPPGYYQEANWSEVHPTFGQEPPPTPAVFRPPTHAPSSSLPHTAPAHTPPPDTNDLRGFLNSNTCGELFDQLVLQFKVLKISDMYDFPVERYQQLGLSIIQARRLHAAIQKWKEEHPTVILDPVQVFWNSLNLQRPYDNTVKAGLSKLRVLSVADLQFMALEDWERLGLTVIESRRALAALKN